MWQPGSTHKTAIYDVSYRKNEHLVLPHVFINLATHLRRIHYEQAEEANRQTRHLDHLNQGQLLVA